MGMAVSKGGKNKKENPIWILADPFKSLICHKPNSFFYKFHAMLGCILRQRCPIAGASATGKKGNDLDFIPIF